MTDVKNKTLTDLQQWMQELILNPFSENRALTEAFVKDSTHLNAVRHLGIYQRSYVARLHDCMSKQFPALEHALGAELFQQFADQYLQTYPSQSYTLMDLGERFPQFLEETRPDRDSPEKESWPDFLIELARFEYALNVIFDEPADVQEVNISETTKDEDLQLTSVFHLFEFRFPINAYYHAFKRGEAPELPFEHASWCVVYKVNDRMAIQGLSYWPYRFLMHWQQSGTLSTALAAIANEGKVSLEKVRGYWAEWRKEWLEAGFFLTRS